jgi:DME family drug/metabolite transporter
VLILGEIWLPPNIIGTGLVILGVVILSVSEPPAGDWNRKDVIYPVLAAFAFGVSTTLRKTGLMTIQVPLLGAAVTVATAFCVLLGIVRLRGGTAILKFNRASNGWLFGGALFNTGAILSFFSALNVGQIVQVEPLVACNPLFTMLWAAVFLKQIEQLNARVVFGGLVTVGGTVLVMTSR